MAWLYRALMVCAVGPLFGYLWWLGRKDPAYRQRWRERLGLQIIPRAWQHGIVLHCASVGEVIAARPLVQRLLEQPGWGPLTITCSTVTGSRQIRLDYVDRVGHWYFPLDATAAVVRFLSRLRPRLVILLERELWPNFLHQAQTLGVPVVLVNGRLSASSAASYRRWRSLVSPALASLRLVCVEDQVVADRMLELGVAPTRLVVTGNIKSDLHIDQDLLQRVGSLRERLGQRPVLTAGSTHAGEDEALIAAFQSHLQGSADSLLVLVPRHPERFDAVARLLQQAGLRFVRHGQGQVAQSSTQVVLGDSMGELMLWYGAADACFVGGSLIARGGHNPLEVLSLHKPLIAGPHTANFATLYAQLQDNDAMLLASDASGVLACFEQLLQAPSAAAAMLARGHALYRQMAGATDRTMAALQDLPALASAGEQAALPMVATFARDTVWANPDCFRNASGDLFDPGWWQQQGSSARHGAGRGNIHRVGDGNNSYLLRHYYRGGLMAKVSRDLFLAQSVANSRAMREFSLLRELCARGLPVPQAAAARHQRVGLWYRSDILVAWIPDARDVAQLLHHQRTLRPDEWQRLGQAVRRLHKEQVCHSDLNCHNLMLDGAGKAWIVDFDKCGYGAGEDWKADNLRRLLRSLRKELRLNPQLHWDESQWIFFLDGYAESDV